MLAHMHPFHYPPAREQTHGESDHLALLEVLDALGIPVGLFDCSGALLHGNRAFAHLMADPDGGWLQAELAQFLQELSARLSLSESDAGTRNLAVAEVHCEQVRCRLRGGFSAASMCGRNGCLLVSIESLAPDPLSEAALRMRFGLGAQTARILCLLVEGRTNRAIARMLRLSPHTVRHHLEHIFKKLGVRSRAEAVARALGR